MVREGVYFPSSFFFIIIFNLIWEQQSAEKWKGSKTQEKASAYVYRPSGLQRSYKRRMCLHWWVCVVRFCYFPHALRIRRAQILPDGLRRLAPFHYFREHNLLCPRLMLDPCRLLLLHLSGLLPSSEKIWFIKQKMRQHVLGFKETDSDPYWTSLFTAIKDLRLGCLRC